MATRKKTRRKKSGPFKGRLGTGKRFKSCVREMRRKPDVEDPEGLCASIGRKKYGKGKFQGMAARGRARKNQGRLKEGQKVRITDRNPDFGNQIAEVMWHEGKEFDPYTSKYFEQYRVRMLTGRWKGRSFPYAADDLVPVEDNPFDWGESIALGLGSAVGGALGSAVAEPLLARIQGQLKKIFSGRRSNTQRANPSRSDDIFKQGYEKGYNLGQQHPKASPTTYFKVREAKTFVNRYQSGLKAEFPTAGVARIRQALDEYYNLYRGAFLKGFREGARRLNNPGALEDMLDEGAAQLSEDFHGRPVEELVQVDTDVDYQENLALLGSLVELSVFCDDGKSEVPVTFDDLAGPDEIFVTATPDGRQIYIVGGNQELDIPALIEQGCVIPDPDKEWLEVGYMNKLVYFTDKHHLQGPKEQKNGIEFVHPLGEESGMPPMLVYDTLNKQMLVVGGNYEIRPEGIVD